MARNTLSRAERYHPKGKIKQITTKLSPSVCDFQRYKPPARPPAHCVANVPAHSCFLAQNLNRHEKAKLVEKSILFR